MANPTVQLLNTTDDSKSKKGDGDYKVCVNMPATLFINPCLWKNNVPIVNVKNGKLRANFSVTAEHGVTFKIHVNDQFGNLIAGPGQPVTNALRTQITSESKFTFPMRLVRRDSDMNLSLLGAPVVVSINNGAKVDASKSGPATPIRVPKGTTPNVLRVDVHDVAK